MSANLEKCREQNRKAQRKHRSKVRELIRSRSHQNSTESIAKSTFLDEEGSEQILISSSIVKNGECSTNTFSDQKKDTFIQSLLLCAISPVQSSSICLPKLQLVNALNSNAERMGIPNKVLTNYWSISTIQQEWKSDPKSDKNQIRTTVMPENENIKRSKTCLTVEENQNIANWRFDRIPQNMLPTPAQLSIEHHPYIDCVFPWSSMRSKILTFMETIFTEEQLCQETLIAHERYGEPAFTIWGDDPMDENSWEVSESFAINWWFLLDRQIINRTNWWRRQQERPEFFNGLKDWNRLIRYLMICTI